MIKLLRKTDESVRKSRIIARKINPQIPRRKFDAVAYSAALEVLG